MVKIRLTRFGKKGQPFYRVVVADERRAVVGRYIEQLGYYHPLSNPPVIKIDMDAYDKWIKSGAKPTDTVKALVKKLKVTQ